MFSGKSWVLKSYLIRLLDGFARPQKPTYAYGVAEACCCSAGSTCSQKGVLQLNITIFVIMRIIPQVRELKAEAAAAAAEASAQWSRADGYNVDLGELRTSHEGLQV